MKKTLTILFIALCRIALAAHVHSMTAARQSIISASPSLPPLPDGVVAVEYLQSSQTQWIDTRLQGNMQGLTIDLQIYPVAWKRYGGMVGNYVDNAHNAVRLGFTWSDDSKAIFGANCRSGAGYINGYSNGYVPGLIGNWHSVFFDIDARKARIDDVATTSSSIGTDNSTIIRLFNGGSGSNGASVRISSFIAYQNGTKIRHLIPVREDNVGCMYDLVTKEMFYNSGSGSFIIGPDKE